MRLSIFARLIISYLVLSGLLAGVSLYFIYHLNRFNQVTHSIHLDDTAISEYSSQISDILLSESRYERKYVVLKDEEIHASYLQAKDEFDQLLDEAFRITTTEKIKKLFHSVSLQHKKFGHLVDEERELIRIAEPYPSEKFEEEKKKITDEIIEQLKIIRQINEKNVFTKIVNLSEQSDKAINVSIIISVFALSIGLIIAFIITRSIKKPLDVMRAKTVEISHGKFQGGSRGHITACDC